MNLVLKYVQAFKTLGFGAIVGGAISIAAFKLLGLHGSQTLQILLALGLAAGSIVSGAIAAVWRRAFAPFFDHLMSAGLTWVELAKARRHFLRGAISQATFHAELEKDRAGRHQPE